MNVRVYTVAFWFMTLWSSIVRWVPTCRRNILCPSSRYADEVVGEGYKSSYKIKIARTVSSSRATVWKHCHTLSLRLGNVDIALALTTTISIRIRQNFLNQLEPIINLVKAALPTKTQHFGFLSLPPDA